MPPIHRYIILFYLFIILTINCAEAATVALRSPSTQNSEFSVNLGEEFDVEIFVDPQGQGMTGVSIYLSFDDQLLELIDASPILSGIQPVTNGTWVPPGWQIFENDTHGDPGNRFIKFQIDYAGQVLDVNAATVEAGVVGTLRFKPLRAAITQITFDIVRPASRVTQATVASGNKHISIPFVLMTPASISVVGGPVIHNGLPDILLFAGQTDESLDLDVHVEDVNDQDSQLEWRASASQNVEIHIDPDSHIVTFRSVGDFLGEEIITFTVVDGQNNSSSADLRVRVVAAPEISFPEEPFRLRTNEEAKLDLNQFVRDDDDLELSGIRWEITQNTDAAIVGLNGSQLIVIGDTPVRTSVLLTATDADGNSDTGEMRIEIAPLVDGPVVDFSSLGRVISTSDGRLSFPREIDLDLYVFDFNFAPQDLVWTTAGNVNIQVEIDPVTHLAVFRGLIGTEEITFIATNPAEQSGEGSIPVTLIDPSAPPIIAEISPIVLDFGEEQTRDLKEFVFDLDSTPAEIEWEFSGNQGVEITISPDRIATFFGEVVVSEDVTFTAIDPQSNRTSVSVPISVLPPKPPQIHDFPTVIEVTHGEVIVGFDLDDFVIDPITPNPDIGWTATGFNEAHLQVTIEPDHGVLFAAQSAWNDGEEIIIFTATNTAGSSSTASTTVILVATQTKQPPVITAFLDVRLTQGNSDDSIVLDEHVSDEDTPIDQIQWTASGNTKIQVTIQPDTRRVIFAAPPDFVGTETITFTATDPDGLSDSQPLNVTVEEKTSTKQPPVVSAIPDVTFMQGTNDSSIVLDEHVSDEDTPVDQIQWTASGNTKIQVTIQPDTRRVTFVAPSDFVGTETITFTATDFDGLSDSQTTRVTVEAPSDGEAPIITGLPDVIFIDGIPNRELALDEFVSDADTPLNQLTWTVGRSGINSPPLNLSVDIDPDTHIVTITPNAGFIGREAVTFTVTDPQQNQAEGTILVEVRSAAPDTKRPIVSAQPIELVAGEVKEINLDDFVTDEDTPDDKILWTMTGNEAISIDLQPSTRIARLQLKPEKKNFRGSEFVSLTATDPEGNSGSDTLEIIVKEPPDRTPPSFQIFVLSNPIQPNFLTLTVIASEPLTSKPTALIRQQPVQMKETGVNRWTGTYTLSKSSESTQNVSSSAVIIVRGADLAGNQGQRTKTLRFNTPLAPSTKSLTVMRVSTYPNPAAAPIVTVECQIDAPAILTVKIYDAKGNLVRTMNDDEFQVVANRLARSCRWNLMDDLQIPISNGMYFCYAIAKSGKVTKTHFWKMAVAR